MKNGRITAIILDDEISVRNGLLRHIRWKQLGVDSVETFESAEKVVVYLKNHAPNIIISDVRLPKMDGIRLVEYVREKELRCRIIFMSAYSDLEYFKEAIRLEAEAYIEKPIRPEQMEEAVRKAVGKIRRDRIQEEKAALAADILSEYTDQMGKRVFKNLVHGIWEEGLMESVGGGKRQIGRGDDFLCMIIKYKRLSGEAEKLKGLLEAYFGRTRRVYDESRAGILACLFAFSRDEYYTKAFADLERFLVDFEEGRFGPGSYFIAVSDRRSGYGEASKLYTQAACQLQKFFFLGYGGLVRQEADGNRVADPAKIPVKEFELALLEEEAGQALRIAEEIYLYLKEQTDSLPDQAKNIFFTLQLSLLQESGMKDELLGGETGTDYLWTRFGDFETIEECYGYLQENIRSYFQNKESFLSGNLKIDRIVRYVRSGFGNVNLSVRDIAEDVGLTPQYMTAVFKEKTGITLGQFIRSTRLEHSRRLLMASESPLGAIAQASGYGDANYWTKAFRKEYGMTPSEYRKRGRK